MASGTRYEKKKIVQQAAAQIPLFFLMKSYCGDTLPDGPDPGMENVRYLAWLKKRGAVVSIQKCKTKWKGGEKEVAGFVKQIGLPYISIQVDGRNGEKVVRLNDKVWADNWMIWYDEEIPHHRQWHNL